MEKKIQFASILRFPVLQSPISYGNADAFDLSKVHIPEDVFMEQLWYTTPQKIHGIFHYEGPTQLFFCGYKCNKCNEVFLVPDTVDNEPRLICALRHACMEK